MVFYGRLNDSVSFLISRTLLRIPAGLTNDLVSSSDDQFLQSRFKLFEHRDKHAY